eukprot:gene10132-21129_t
MSYSYKLKDSSENTLKFPKYKSPLNDPLLFSPDNNNNFQTKVISSFKDTTSSTKSIPPTAPYIAKRLPTNVSIGGVSIVPKDSKELKSETSTETTKENDALTLSEKQKKVLDLILSNQSVFFTGAAGTGKSHILRIFQTIMEQLQLIRTVAFTAPTGVAACNISGLTIHSWAGVGTGADPVEKLARKVAGNKEAKKRWISTKILVIDEISMLSAELFDKLSTIGSHIRQNPAPFGGIQLIICGDFFQLPPIGLGVRTQFSFKADSWNKIFHTGNNNNSGNMIVLDKVFRQKDPAFLNMLHELRRGVVSQYTSQVLQNKVNSCSNNNNNSNSAQSSSTPTSTSKSSSIRPTKLFSTNRDVDAINGRELKQLSSNAVTYLSEDWSENEAMLTQLKSGTKAPETLELKIGTQVMLLKNLDTAIGLVNGARGVVTAFQASNGTALLRRNTMLPVVEFLVTVGSRKDIHTKVLLEETWDIRQGDRILASRMQIPLMLAWAISVHKSQGMTIPLLEVSFNGMFEYGQGYVALSRATDMEGLVLHSFDARTIKAHPQVGEFYKTLGYASESDLCEQSLITTSIALLVSSYGNTNSANSATTTIISTIPASASSSSTLATGIHQSTGTSNGTSNGTNIMVKTDPMWIETSRKRPMSSSNSNNNNDNSGSNKRTLVSDDFMELSSSTSSTTASFPASSYSSSFKSIATATAATANEITHPLLSSTLSSTSTSTLSFNSFRYEPVIIPSQIPSSQIPSSQIPSSQIPSSQIPSSQIPSSQIPSSSALSLSLSGFQSSSFSFYSSSSSSTSTVSSYVPSVPYSQRQIPVPVVPLSVSTSISTSTSTSTLTSGARRNTLSSDQIWAFNLSEDTQTYPPQNTQIPRTTQSFPLRNSQLPRTTTQTMQNTQTPRTNTQTMQNTQTPRTTTQTMQNTQTPRTTTQTLQNTQTPRTTTQTTQNTQTPRTNTQT